MKLYRVNFLLNILHRGDGVFGFSGGAKTFRNGEYAVAETIPDFQFSRKALQKLTRWAFGQRMKFGAAVFAAFHRLDFSPKRFRNSFLPAAVSAYVDSPGPKRGL